MVKKLVKFFIYLFILIPTAKIISQEREKFNYSPNYLEIQKTIDTLQKKSPYIKVNKAGPTDCGEPLLEIIISKRKIFSSELIKKNKFPVLFINNGIHPGEPDGIDACLRWMKAIHENQNLLPNDLVIVIVPVFNIDGALNRSSNSRVNQNGPVEYGFRGNAKNLDLNRDFIKCDSKNTMSLIELIRKWDPDVFLDTHVSNGSDYQYTMTLISTQHNKLGGKLGGYLKTEFTPALFKAMKEKGHEMAPYVESVKETPDDGIMGFLESPRYSTGYTSLFQSFGFVSETHMWKPYHERVWATYDFIQVLAEYCDKNGKKLIQLRETERNNIMKTGYLPLKWELDTNRFDTIIFKGFHAEKKPSKISGKMRLFYNRERPFEKTIPFYDYYSYKDSVKVPKYYFVPQAYDELLKILEVNKVNMIPLNKDTLVKGISQRVISFRTVDSPYEGHYLHKNIIVEENWEELQFRKGDFMIPVKQLAARFLIETFEAKSEDSYFAWNFFDSFLQQKEWFSDYIFEEKAEEILLENPKIKMELENEKLSNPKLNDDHWQQLNFIYQRSEFKEKSHKRIPVLKTFD